MDKEIRCHNKPWLKHYEKGVSEEIEFEEAFLHEFLERSAGKFPDKTALIFQGYKITYRELNDMVNQFAACLIDFEIDKGDRVAILLPNSIPCVVSYYAILKIGGIAVMNNPMYSDRELNHQFNDAGAKVLITLDLLANRMITLRPETTIKQIVYTSIGDYLPFAKNLLFKFVAKKKKLAADVSPYRDVYRWKEVLNRYSPKLPDGKLSIDDIAMYQYTGGTTGISKGVMLSHSNLSIQVQQIASWFPEFSKNDEIMLGCLPFFHAFGLSAAMNWAIFMGWPNVLVLKPQPAALLETIRKFKPTIVPFVPTMIIGMLSHPDINKTDMTCIKGCFSGSAPISVEVIKKFEDKTGAIIVEGFGLTEASPITHINPFGGSKRKVGSIGLPVPNTKCKIVDLNDSNTEIPAGETGELVIRGPQVMNGYWGKPEETAQTLKDGWLHTGDIAKMDEEGYFYIIDRKKDMIISGGFNVYPRDIEEVFYENPKVQEACCIGIPHPGRGEAAKVFVVLKEGKSATAKELIEFCKPRIARYKLPTEIEFRKKLPKTNIGKIARKDLKAENRFA